MSDNEESISGVEPKLSFGQQQIGVSQPYVNSDLVSQLRLDLLCLLDHRPRPRVIGGNGCKVGDDNVVAFKEALEYAKELLTFGSEGSELYLVDDHAQREIMSHRSLKHPILLDPKRNSISMTKNHASTSSIERY